MVDSAVTQNIEDLTATLPVVISHKEAIYLYGLDIIWTRKRAVRAALFLDFAKIQDGFKVGN